ncbi:MAG: cupin domain-containing protein [Chloroflexota bacterium]|nr:cupin domain-containing protein [Chloroflexota bacterium]
MDLSDQPLQPLVITLPPGHGSGADAIHHSGYEFIYCLSGVLEYFVDEKKFTMQAGDSLIFNAQHPHRWDNHGKEPVEYLLIMMPNDIKDLPADVHFFTKS